MATCSGRSSDAAIVTISVLASDLVARMQMRRFRRLTREMAAATTSTARVQRGTKVTAPPSSSTPAVQSNPQMMLDT